MTMSKDDFVINVKVIVLTVAGVMSIVIGVMFKKWVDDESAFKNSVIEEHKKTNQILNNNRVESIRLEGKIDNQDERNDTQEKTIDRHEEVLERITIALNRSRIQIY
jgi:hypothetical protein